MEIKKQLKDLGFSDYKARVLVALITENRLLSAKELAAASQVPLTRIYSLLIELEKDKLVMSGSGPLNRYRAVGKESLLRRIKEMNTQRLSEQMLKIDSSVGMLSKSLENYAHVSEDVEVRMCTTEEEYWPLYIKATGALKKNDTYIIINNIKIGDSYLSQDLKNSPMLRDVNENDKRLLKRGVIIHHFTNPKALVENTVSMNPDKAYLRESMKEMLSVFRDYLGMGVHHITLCPELKNLVVVITTYDIFLEFYKGNSIELKFALMLHSQRIAEDFHAWAKSLDKKERHDPRQDLKDFEREIWKECSGSSMK